MDLLALLKLGICAGLLGLLIVLIVAAIEGVRILMAFRRMATRVDRLTDVNFWAGFIKGWFKK
ncbi:MAG: hypothetical protein AB7F28_06650 [Candidatus Margulisiibacteriota bacterium]